MEKEFLSDRMEPRNYIKSLTDAELVSGFKTASSRRELIGEIFWNSPFVTSAFFTKIWKKDFNRLFKEDKMFIGFCRTENLNSLLDNIDRISHFDELEFLLRFVFEFKLYEVDFMKAFYDSSDSIWTLEEKDRGVEIDLTKTDSFYSMLKAYKTVIEACQYNSRDFIIMFIFLSVWEDFVSSEIKEIISGVMTKDVSFFTSGTLYELTRMAVEGSTLDGKPNASFVELVNDQPAGWILAMHGFEGSIL